MTNEQPEPQTPIADAPQGPEPYRPPSHAAATDAKPRDRKKVALIAGLAGLSLAGALAVGGITAAVVGASQGDSITITSDQGGMQGPGADGQGRHGRGGQDGTDDDGTQRGGPRQDGPPQGSTQQGSTQQGSTQQGTTNG